MMPVIVDTLANAVLYLPVAPGLDAAFRFLETADLAMLPVGSHELPDGFAAIVSDGQGRKAEEGKLEVHRRFIDIQYVIEGSDAMGWKPLGDCVKPSGPFDVEKDLGFFDDEPDGWVTVRAGSFALFLPTDAHLPLVSDGRIQKVVMKVPV